MPVIIALPEAVLVDDGKPEELERLPDFVLEFGKEEIDADEEELPITEVDAADDELPMTEVDAGDEAVVVIIPDVDATLDELDKAVFEDTLVVVDKLSIDVDEDDDVVL